MDLLISIIIVTLLLLAGNLYVYYGYNKEKDAIAMKINEYQSILSNMNHGVLVIDLSGEILYMNKSTTDFVGSMKLALAVGDPIEMLINRLNQYADVDDNLTRDKLTTDDEPVTFVFKAQGLFATYSYYEVNVCPLMVQDAKMGHLMIVKDVTERVVTKMIDNTIIKTSLNATSLKSMEDALNYFSSALEEIIDIDYVFATVVDQKPITYHINHREPSHSNKMIKSQSMSPISSYVMKECRALTMTLEELEEAGLGKELDHYDKKPELLVACPLHREGQAADGVIGLLFTEAIAYPQLVEDSLKVIVKYITQVLERITIEEQIHNLAYYDQLTHLPNRNKFIMTLEQEMINTSLTDNQILGVLFLDFSGLKRINDEYGHYVGDQLLKNLAAELIVTSEGMFVIGRLGGDEFGIFTTATTRVEIEGIARLVLETIDKPFMIEGHMVHVTGNVGISIYGEHGTHPETLIHKADEALFEAKNLGKSQYYMWD